MDGGDVRMCGLDVGHDAISACVRIPAKNGVREESRGAFGTTPRDLSELRDWLWTHEVTHVGLSSTGGFWKPVARFLEEHFQLVVVNPERSGSSEPRCVRIVELLEQGLWRSDPILPAALRELEHLKRYRKGLLLERRREIHRLHKVLQDAGIKLSRVAKNILGASGRAILSALLEGNRDPAALAELARGRLRAKLPQLTDALRARFGEHHLFLATEMLAHIDSVDETLDRVSDRVGAVARSLPEPFQAVEGGRAVATREAVTADSRG